MNRSRMGLSCFGKSNKLPPYAAAVLGSLHLTDPASPRLTDDQWQQALDYADRSRVTLLLQQADLPQWVRDRVEDRATKNCARIMDIEQRYRDISQWLTDAGLEFVALKGMSHSALLQ